MGTKARRKELDESDKRLFVVRCVHELGVGKSCFLVHLSVSLKIFMNFPEMWFPSCLGTAPSTVDHV